MTYLGLRPGEKLYEELLVKTEELDKTDNSMIFIERDNALSKEEIYKKIDVLRDQIYPREESPDMLMLDLFLAHLKTMRSCQKNMGLSYRCFELRRDTWNE